jgi:hypothetical protein
MAAKKMTLKKGKKLQPTKPLRRSDGGGPTVGR